MIVLPHCEGGGGNIRYVCLVIPPAPIADHSSLCFGNGMHRRRTTWKGEPVHPPKYSIQGCSRRGPENPTTYIPTLCYLYSPCLPSLLLDPHSARPACRAALWHRLLATDYIYTQNAHNVGIRGKTSRFSGSISRVVVLVSRAVCLSQITHVGVIAIKNALG